MKFGLIMVPQVRKGQPEPFHELLEQIEFAEELGYDSVWLTEHHFSEYGRAAVPALAGAAAARTSRIRISTAIVVLPFHHPIRVAEDWATLDHLSNGRVDVGIGRAVSRPSSPGSTSRWTRRESAIKSRSPSSRRPGRRRVSPTTASSGRFRRSRCCRSRSRSRTRRSGVPRLAPYTVKMTVDNGINGLIGPYLTPFEVLKRDYFDVWHAATAEAGRTDLEMCHNEFVYVGESDAEVKADVEEYVMWYLRKAAKIWGHRDPKKAATQYANYTDILEFFDTVQFDEVYRDLAILGTPDTVTEKLRWLRDEGKADYIMNFMWFGGISHEKAMRNMELFAREVMPRLVADRAAEPVVAG